METTDSPSTLANSLAPPPYGFAPCAATAIAARSFGRNSRPAVTPRQRQRPFGMPLGPQRKQLVRRDEILRRRARSCTANKHGRQHEEREPEQRRQRTPSRRSRIPRDARLQPVHDQQAEVHQVALAPAAVALAARRSGSAASPRSCRRGRRRSTPPSRRAASAPPRRSRATGSRRTARRGPGRRPSAQWRMNGCDADDRVVAPVVRLAELPEVQAGGEQRAVDARRRTAARARTACRGRRRAARSG